MQGSEPIETVAEGRDVVALEVVERVGDEFAEQPFAREPGARACRGREAIGAAYDPPLEPGQFHRGGCKGQNAFETAAEA
ncbi:MAG: hypothetical protein NZM07_03080 [Elioraea sp.]|nr:hypothetical protein [Elioraea sp.]